MELELQTALSTLCDRVFISVAPEETPTPFIVWQQTGGQDFSSTENDQLMRHARVQISVWAQSALEATTLRSQIEPLLRHLPNITCTPSASHYMTYEPDTGLHGVQQVWHIT